MKNKVLRITALATAGLMLPLLPACGKGDEGGSGEAQSGKSGKPAEIRWVTTGDQAAKPLNQDDRIMTKINEDLGIKLNVEIVPESSVERVNVEMASKNIPDLVTGAYGTTATQSWIDNDLLVPLNDYMQDRPSLKSRLEDDYSWTAQDGKYWGVPFINQFKVANVLVAMRQDWLDNLGLKYPETIEDFEKVMMAFTNDDPDGNGKDDTFGYTDAKPAGNFDWVYGAFGMEHFDYDMKDGKVIPRFETQAFKDGITFVKKLWDAGCIDKEFMLNDNAKKEEKFYQNKAGAMPTPLYRHVNRIEGNLKQLYPDASIAYGLPPKGKDGKFGMNPQGKNGMFTAITVDCKAPDKAADFIEFMLSDEGCNLVRLGIEGVHYTKEGDKIVYNEEEREKDGFSPNGWAHPLAWGSFFWPLESSYLPETEPNRERALESVEMACKAQLPNLVMQKTPSEIKYGSQLDTVYDQAVIDILQGKDTIDNIIDKLGKDWREQGGDEVLKELQEVVDAQAK